MNALLIEYKILISRTILIKHFDLITFLNTLTYIHVIYSYKNQIYIDLYEESYL